MYRMFLVPLAALAFLLVPLGADARTACEAPCLAEFFDSTTSVPRAGTVVTFTYKALPTSVDSLTATLVLPQGSQLVLLKKGSTPFQVVENKPTWTRHNLNSTAYIHFRVLVKKTAPKGRRQFLWLRTVAVSGGWAQKASLVGILHVAKH